MTTIITMAKIFFITILLVFRNIFISTFNFSFHLFPSVIIS